MKTFIEVFGIISVFLVMLTTYLSVNKIWIRKHEPEVADSISISSTSINLIVMLIGIMISVYNLNYGLIVSYLVWSASIIFYIFLGIGLWVKNDLSMLEKLKRALSMDQKESTVIIKDLLHISCIEKILKILFIFAMVDGKLHKNEEKVLRDFSKEHGVNYDDIFTDLGEALQEKDPLKVMFNLKHEINEYLKTSPQKSIVTWLQDLIDMLSKADDEVTEDEAMMLAEIQGLFESYMSNHGQNIEKFNVLIIPQSKEQTPELLSDNLKVKKLDKSVHGSILAYIAASFYSEKLAEKARKEYVNLYSCFVTIEKF